MLVPLDSPEGRRRLQAALVDGTAQPEVVESYRKQRGNTVCGLASLAVVLTARARSASRSEAHQYSAALSEASAEAGAAAVAASTSTSTSTSSQRSPGIGKERRFVVDEDDVYPLLGSRGSSSDSDSASASWPASSSDSASSQASPLAEETVVSEAKVRTSGMTLEQARALASALPGTENAIALFAAEEGDGNRKSKDKCKDKCKDNSNSNSNAIGHSSILSGPDALREIALETLSKTAAKESLVANYHMTTLGQAPFGGHLSPLAAYHGDSDSLLVMDVWHSSTEPVWASVQNLWSSMADAIDPESSRTRGLLRIYHGHGHGDCDGRRKS